MNKNTGFTLIELMIVVAIVGIISAIAFPSYNSYMNKSRRTDAKVGLLRLADLQERFFLQNNTYATSMVALGATVLTENSHYELAVVSANANAFVLEADADGPTASGQTGDTTTPAGDCTLMTLSALNVKTPPACW